MSSLSEQAKNYILKEMEEASELDDIVSAFMEDAMDCSEDDVRTWGGSEKGKSGNKKRDFVSAYRQLVDNYFKGDLSKYSEADFERRSRCPRSIFHLISEAVLGKILSYRSIKSVASQEFTRLFG